MIKTKLSIFFIVLFSYCFQLPAQDQIGKLNQVIISIGPNLSNFINSEAPHKTQVFGRALFIGSLYQDYTYKTSIIQDIKVGLNLGIGFEFQIKNQTSMVVYLQYEEKGIDIKYHNRWRISADNYSPDEFIDHEELFKKKIKNNYLTVPISVKQEIGQKGFYLKGGFYVGFLIESTVQSHNKKTEASDSEYFYHYSEFEYKKHQSDRKLEYTNRKDLGLSFAVGHSHPVLNKWSINTEITSNIGLLKVDQKFNNEYEKTLVSSSSGVITNVVSNNYYGLNSNAKNISVAITVGIAYQFNK